MLCGRGKGERSVSALVERNKTQRLVTALKRGVNWVFRDTAEVSKGDSGCVVGSGAAGVLLLEFV